MNIKFVWLLAIVFIATFFSQVHAEGTFRFSVSRTGGPHLDPHSVQGDLELHLNPNIFEGLLKIEPDTGNLVPCLATDYSWISPEIVEFELRKNVRFHNGEPFTAEAVKYSFERMAQVENGFNWVSAILPEYDRVEIINPSRIRIILKKHNSIFLISSRFFVILPPRYLKEFGTEHFLRHPVGTGPFKIETIDYDEEVVQTVHLIKNEDYWDPEKPKLDNVVYHFGRDRTTSISLLQQQKIDGMADVPIRNILDVKKLGLDVREKKQGLLSWLFFNLTKYKQDTPIWAPEVRKAIMHAIHYDQIREVVYRNRAEQNNQWAFPGLPGYSDSLQNFPYDPDKSKAYLAEAGYDKGFTLHAYCDDVSLDAAKILKTSLAKIGITVEFDILDEATNNCFLSSRKNPDSPCHPLLKKYDFMLGDFGWGLPHNYVTHLHTFSLDSFVSMVSEEYPGATETKKMFDDAKEATGSGAMKKWETLTEYELERLSVAGLMLKKTYFAVPATLDWEVFGSYDFSKAAYRDNASK